MEQGFYLTWDEVIKIATILTAVGVIITLFVKGVHWFDKQEKCVKHFTHKMFEGGHSDLFFKGAIEVLTIARFNALCEKKNKPHLAIY